LHIPFLPSRLSTNLSLDHHIVITALADIITPMAKLEPYKGGYYLWQYVPSIAAAVIFLLLFLSMTALISWRMFKTKTWFCLPFAIGGFCKLSPARPCALGTDTS
jgi:VIT1/CCC1 family predicted Fe2+/Mn2+ transporter